MAIVPIPRSNCSSVLEFFQQGCEIEVSRPPECVNEQCRLAERMRKHGKYMRQVIYWGWLFTIWIARFCCRRCGKTASRPPGWLIPYRRFSAEEVAAGIEAYAQKRTTYKELSWELNDEQPADPDLDISQEPAFKELTEDGRLTKANREPTDEDSGKYRPAANTIFYWVDFVCRRVEAVLMQTQKELVKKDLRKRGSMRLPDETGVVNPNGWKAASTEKQRMLDRLSLATSRASNLLGKERQLWNGLRAYFLEKAESCKDLLTAVAIRLPRPQTFE